MHGRLNIVVTAGSYAAASALLPQLFFRNLQVLGKVSFSSCVLSDTRTSSNPAVLPAYPFHTEMDIRKYQQYNMIAKADGTRSFHTRHAQ